MILLLHNPVEGIGSFYGGLLHPWVVPEQVLLLVTLSACLAQQGLPAMRRAIPIALLALVGAVFVQPVTGWIPPQSPVLILGAALGLSVAAQLRLPSALLCVLGALYGIAIGFGTDVLEILAGEEALFQVGAILGAGIGLLCLAVWLESAKRPWQKLVVRVLGSWAAAASLIVLTWQLVRD